MKSWRWWIGGVGVLALVYGAVWAAGHWRAGEATRDVVQRMEAAAAAASARPARHDRAELEGLPPPVQRYFRRALPDGARIARAVTIEQTGQFDTGQNVERWVPFTAWQRNVAARPGFVWDASMAMGNGVRIRVLDAYVAGEGLMRPSLMGLVPLAESRGGGEIARGELMRWLAEAVWMPTALLPGQGVRWTPVDDRSARATVRDGDVEVSLLFRFGDDDLVASVRSEDRGRSVDGRFVPTPWEGHFRNPQPREGMLVPMQGEVAWVLPEGPRPYWRGTITALAYTFAGP